MTRARRFKHGSVGVLYSAVPPTPQLIDLPDDHATTIIATALHAWYPPTRPAVITLSDLLTKVRISVHMTRPNPQETT